MSVDVIEKKRGREVMEVVDDKIAISLGYN